ncbi:uncharacterized protein [Diadema setosum]|uniref:uncharacterized protein n=1 Tax=Diadema setosum TaxID=31175 RepID=UPI003B3AE291
MAVYSGMIMTFYAVLVCIGVPGNTIILVGYGLRKRKIGTDIVIMGMASIDLLCSLLHVMKMNVGSFANDNFCRWLTFLSTAPTFVQLLLTTTVAIDRYIAICWPLNRRLTPRKAFIAVLLCYFVSTMIPIPGVVMAYYDKLSKVCRRTDKSIQWLRYFHAVVFPSFFYPSLLVTVLLYIRIAHVLYKRVKIHATLVGLPKKPVASATGTSSAVVSGQLRPIQENSTAVTSATTSHVQNIEIAPAASGVTHTQGSSRMVLPAAQGDEMKERGPSFNTPGIKGSGEHPSNAAPPSAATTDDSATAVPPGRQRTKDGADADQQLQEQKTTRMLVVVALVFFISWIPTIVQTYVPRSTWYRIALSSDLIHTLYTLSYRLYEINSATNFFLYWALNSRFRRDCKILYRNVRKLFGI